MFQFSIKKEDLLAALLIVSGAVDKKNAVAILSNFLIKVSDGFLFLSATDLEIEISAQVVCDSEKSSGTVTVPAKKFMDIIRSLDDHAVPCILFDQGLLTIKQGRSSFKLTTLPAEHYPQTQDECAELELTLSRLVLLQLLQSTHFALAQQDVRIYLNGLFFEFGTNLISAVASDGHRMAINHLPCTNSIHQKLIIPKKAIQELLRLLNLSNDDNVVLRAGKIHLKLMSNEFIFVTKLIEARFPPYAKAIPKAQDKHIVVDSELLKRALTRIIILAQEKSKAVLLHLQSGQLTLVANNNEQEEAEETIAAQTQGEDFTIALNASYLLDVLNHFGTGQVRLSMSNTDTSILVESLLNDLYHYLIMPMKI